MTERITEEIKRIVDGKGSAVIAIDGRCASGKTTLSGELEKSLDCNVFHADDFFLRPEQRTPERLAEPGGNFDRERFLEEVLKPVSERKDVVFRPFVCKTMSLGEEQTVRYKKITVIEGSYCCHPDIAGYYDIKVFLDIGKNEQKMRVLKRNADKAEMFFFKWIPLEEKYFEAFDIKGKADISLRSN